MQSFKFIIKKRICRFLLSTVLLLVAVSCKNPNSSKKELQKVAPFIQAENSISFDEKVLACFTRKEIASLKEEDGQFVLLQVSEISEVRQYSSENKDHISYCIADDQASTDFYTVRVGIEDEDHFGTHYLFNVHKKTKEIKIFEPVSDSLMTIDAWRKRK